MYWENAYQVGDTLRNKELAIQNLLTIINTSVVWESLDERTQRKLVRMVAEYTKRSVENALSQDFKNLDDNNYMGLYK